MGVSWRWLQRPRQRRPCAHLDTRPPVKWAVVHFLQRWLGFRQSGTICQSQADLSPYAVLNPHLNFDAVISHFLHWQFLHSKVPLSENHTLEVQNSRDYIQSILVVLWTQIYRESCQTMQSKFDQKLALLALVWCFAMCWTGASSRHRNRLQERHCHHLHRTHRFYFHLASPRKRWFYALSHFSVRILCFQDRKYWSAVLKVPGYRVRHL